MYLNITEQNAIDVNELTSVCQQQFVWNGTFKKYEECSRGDVCKHMEVGKTTHRRNNVNWISSLVDALFYFP